MDTSKNTLIILGGAGLLFIILIIFGLSGAESDPTNAPPVPDELDVEEVPAVSGDDNYRGVANPAVTLIEYSDIECPFCQRYHETLTELTEEEELENFGWVYRHLPLETLHPDAKYYASATECAGEQGFFWSYLDALNERVQEETALRISQLSSIGTQVGLDTTPFRECVEEERFMDAVEDERDDAFNAGATGTPFSVFVFESPLSDDAIDAITNLYQNRASLDISEDRTKVAIGGGLEANQIRQLINFATTTPENSEGEEVE